MSLPLVTLCFLIGLSMTLSIATKSVNETEVETLENVDFGEMESDNESEEIQRKRDSGYNYQKPIRYNRPHFHSRNRGRFSQHRNQLNRPFNLYGPPKTQDNLNLKRPNNHHREPNQSPDNLHQGIPNPIKNHEFAETDPIPEQNDFPFLTGTANYLPPKNQKLPSHSSSNAFSRAQGHQNQQLQAQNFIKNYLKEHRISDAALFLTQNAKTLSQLYGAPAPNQEYAPNNEYLSQLSSQQQNMQKNPHFQMENVAGTEGSQGFPGPLPSYASGILNLQETLESIQSIEKDRLIAQLRLALENQARLQDSTPLGRNAPVHENVYHQAGNEAANLGSQQLVSPSVFGGEQTAFGHVPFLSGSAISPPGFKVTYGSPTSSQVPVNPAPTIQPQGPVAGTSSSSGSVAPGSGSLRPGSGASTPSFTPNFPQYGTYIPTLIPGTNFVANVPALGSGFLGSSLIPLPSHPSSSSPTHFGIPIPVIPTQKPVSGTPTLTIPSAFPGKPGVQISGPGHPVADPVHPLGTPVHPVANPTHPGATPGQTVHPVANPTHPVANPVHPVANPVHPIYPIAHPVQPIRPITAPAYPEVTPVHPTYGVQSSFLNSLFIKPLKPVFPFYYYPNIQLQIPKPTLTTQPWNYASTLQHPKPNWKR